MPSYAAFLGHQPHISIAELGASIRDFELQRVLGGEVVLFGSTLDLDASYLQTLGGTVAIARKVHGKPATGLGDIPDLLRDEVKGVAGKVTFSLRGFGLPPKHVRDLYRACKAALRSHGRPARYVGTERNPAVSVLLHDEGLLDGSHGCELVLIKEGDDLWVGRTVAAQDVNAYAKRDMEKPARDTRVGLLPPKLAQILLNFGAWLVHGTVGGNAEKRLTVFDPFCGTGVVPIEAMLRGWNVLASDDSLRAVHACERNLEWLRKEHGIMKKDVTGRVWKQDARKAFNLKERPDVIVTETTLGPPLEKKAPLKEASRLKTAMEDLQEAFLRNVAETLPGVPVVATWPVWYTSKGPVRLEKVWDKLHDIGFRIAIPAAVDLEVTGQPVPNGHVRASRPTLVYRRPGQYVGREIVMLQSTRKAS
ncbi:MAG: RsmD family RNA methyltransferase [Patescibacteria group bacterium]